MMCVHVLLMRSEYVCKCSERGGYLAGLWAGNSILILTATGKVCLAKSRLISSQIILQGLTAPCRERKFPRLITASENS
jgi:hypothetical protein